MRGGLGMTIVFCRGRVRDRVDDDVVVASRASKMLSRKPSDDTDVILFCAGITAERLTRLRVASRFHALSRPVVSVLEREIDGCSTGMRRTPITCSTDCGTRLRVQLSVERTRPSRFSISFSGSLF